MVRLGPIPWAIAAAVVASLPVSLVGALALLVRQDVPFGEGGLGALAAIHFLASALASIPVSRAIGAYSASRVLACALAGTFASLLALGLVAREWSQMAALMAVSGASHAGVQLAANHFISQRIHPRRQGIVFGLKQATAPLAALLAGLSVPVLAPVLGWRVAFVVAGVLTAVLLAGAIRTRVANSPAAQIDLRMSSGPLLLLAVASAFGAAAGNSLSPFLVDFAYTSGFAASDAGLVLAGGAAAGIAARVLAGWVADRAERGALLIMSAMLALGCVGVSVLAFEPALPVLVAAVLIAYFGAWGWPGLLLLAIARASREDVARVMGVVAMGPLIGSVLGPLAFGILAEYYSYGAAWGFAAIAAGLGSLLAVIARRRILARPFSMPAGVFPHT